MEAFYVALLGVIQGATEFLPVSSSGHLAAGQLLLGDRLGEFLDGSLTLEVLLHVATLAAVMAFYRREILDCLLGTGRAVVSLFRRRLLSSLREDTGASLALAVLAGSLPTAILGLLLEERVRFIASEPLRLGLAFLGTASVLFASRWWTGGTRRLSLPVALVVGAIQGAAVIPGVSRSGVTIAAALALGLEREEAVKFSFLLSLPAVAGAALLEIDVSVIGAEGRWETYLLGALAAFAVGVVALYFLVRLVRGGRLWLFAPYVTALGIATMFLSRSS